jgi:hypothetical protein
MFQKIKLAGLLLAAALLCSCASVSVVDTWRNPGVSAARLHKVLIMSITKKDANRAVYEDVLASELAQHGVNAVPSHTLMPSGMKAERENLDQAVKKSGADAVLTLQTIKVERQTTVDSGFASYPGYWYPQAFPSWDLYGYYGSMNAYGPAYISSYDIATLQANVFETATGKLVWAATFTSSEPEKVISVAKDLARLMVKKMQKEGLL